MTELLLNKKRDKNEVELGTLQKSDFFSWSEQLYIVVDPHFKTDSGEKTRALCFGPSQRMKGSLVIIDQKTIVKHIKNIEISFEG